METLSDEMGNPVSKTGIDIDHRMVAEALSKCRYAPGTSAKRFAQTLGGMAEKNMPLSEKQAKYMYQLACQKRNQVGSFIFNLVPRGIWADYKKEHKTIR